jgi:hypothetical protein
MAATLHDIGPSPLKRTLSAWLGRRVPDARLERSVLFARLKRSVLNTWQPRRRRRPLSAQQPMASSRHELEPQPEQALGPQHLPKLTPPQPMRNQAPRPDRQRARKLAPQPEPQLVSGLAARSEWWRVWKLVSWSGWWRVRGLVSWSETQRVRGLVSWSGRRRVGTGAMCTACALNPNPMCPCLITPWQVTR